MTFRNASITSLRVPERIGRYQVLGPLGRGGMGLVYLARDEALDRDVAIKVLPDEVARDPERLAWFAREAKALAALNHPHIATVHGFETGPDGTRFLVLERIDGVTLAERLRSGPMGAGEAIPAALQIADALETAHEAGIIHRDLKPGNVMITPRGRVKLLDFGLARRVTDAELPPAGGTDADVLGTPGYASPEQIRGEPTDSRTDIFAFGSLLFECLTGRKAFGAQAPWDDVTRATLQGAPAWEGSEPGIPAELRALVDRCLEKRPHDRPAAMAEIHTVLAGLGPADPRHSLAGPSPGDGSDPGVRLPHALTRFVGRGKEITEGVELLAKTRLLTLIGMAGCGKTRLAVEIARRRTRGTREAATFVDLAPLREDTGMVEAIAAAAGLKETSGQPLRSSVIEAFQTSATMLILDNCEHMVATAASTAQDLLRACPALTILATSREPLGIAGEQIVPVEPFPVPDPSTPRDRDLMACESIELFVDRARATTPDFAPASGELRLLAEICRRLEGIPLAIELAAARTQLLSLEQIHSRLEDRFRLLASPAAPGHRHHRTLHEAIAWSHDQLVEVERAFFRRLAVFSGGWTLEAATVMEDARDEFATLDLLTRLWNKSLLTVERGRGREEPRYRYLETVREFALERLHQSGEEESIRERQLDHFIDVVERTYPSLGGGPHQGEAVARLGRDHHNLLEVLAWCGRAAGREGKAVRLASHLWSFWMLRGEYTAGRRELAAALDRPGAEDRTVTRSRGLYGEGWLASLQGDLASARSRMEQSLAIARELGDTKAISRALGGLGVVAHESGDVPLAREYGMQSLEMNRTIGNSKGVAAGLRSLANLAFRQGDVASAKSFTEEALALHRERGDQEGTAGALSNLTDIYLRMGLTREARASLLECLRMSRVLQLKHVGAAGVENAAALLCLEGHAWTGARMTGAAEALWSSLGYALSADDLADHEVLLEKLRAALGAERMERARREGGSLTLDGALDEALATLEGGDPEAATR